MNAFDELEKFINEHGSSPILRDNVAFLREQMAELIRENIALKNKLSVRTSGNDKQDSMEIGNPPGKRPFHDNIPLEEIRLKILVYLTSNRSKTAVQISEAIEISEHIIAFQLLEMKRDGLVAFEHVDTIGYCWYLEQKGRKYLIDNGLIT